jgi:SnoaL-like domain
VVATGGGRQQRLASSQSGFAGGCVCQRLPSFAVFADLNQYDVTTHFNGQSTVTIDGSRATGESYTIAHHVFTEDDRRKIMIASLRYFDTFVKLDDGGWYFAERNLIVDWTETRTQEET